MKWIDRLWGHMALMALAVFVLGIAIGGAVVLYLGGTGAVSMKTIETVTVITRNIGLVVIAVLALLLAWNRTQTASRQADISNAQAATANRQARTAETGLIIDRFQKGAQMLESEKLYVRFAGIYALRELAKNNPAETYIMVLDLLFDFARERSKNRGRAQPRGQFGDQKVMPELDFQMAIATACKLRTAITSAEAIEAKEGFRPNLMDAKLYDVALIGANLNRAILTGADLSNAALVHAELSGAILWHTNLSGCELMGIILNKETRLDGCFADRHSLPKNMPPELADAIELRDPKDI